MMMKRTTLFLLLCNITEIGERELVAGMKVDLWLYEAFEGCRREKRKIGWLAVMSWWKGIMKIPKAFGDTFNGG
ncbi:hypothetical protein GcM1_06800 [Golovinomyces cichoracearum]|uniref:Uncharacterized protein n=1 Tax=Golovinomyces cichoracearum TaxID=62708 RepID=A0A420JC71_9PEZI|nr:hypothetical protein GcM1_06800 [Golovinomyces cichoracearum]